MLRDCLDREGHRRQVGLKKPMEVGNRFPNLALQQRNIAYTELAWPSFSQGLTLKIESRLGKPKEKAVLLEKRDWAMWLWAA